jgi:hypothetical protein
MDDNIKKINEIAQGAVGTLFTTFGLPMPRPIDASGDPLSYLSRDRFGFMITMGPEMNGAWGVSADPRLLQETHKKVTKKDMFDENDWLAELTNQIVGTIKGTLVKYHVDLEVSAALTVDRDRLVDSFLPISPIRFLRFQCNDMQMTVFYSVFFASDVNLSSVPDEGAVIGGLGDSVIF